MTCPWDDCMVAFGYDGDDEILWAERLDLPEGWSLDGTDGAGARMVVVFRVDGVPAFEDGIRVRALLDRLAVPRKEEE